MGRTVPTFRMVLEHVIGDWHAFRRALRTQDRDAFDALMHRARLHAAAASNASRLNPAEALFMAILVEHEKELSQLRGEVKNTVKYNDEHAEDEQTDTKKEGNTDDES